MSTRSRSLFLISLLTALPLSALAQNAAKSTESTYSAATPTVAASDATLGEVVVTAERVESTVQKTSASVDVVSGNALTKNDVVSLANITAVEPSVIFNQSSFNGAAATIRGVSSNGGNGAAVIVDMDGQYILTGFNPALYDVSRLEVLKGPQGTLYGLNSTGGAINIITNAPKLGQLDIDGNMEYGDYNERTYGAELNLPAGDTVALRFAGFSTSHDGYRTHPGMDATDLADTNGVRMSLLWQPNDKLHVELTGEDDYENFGGNAQQGVLLNPASPLTPKGLPPTNFTVQNGDVNPHEWGLDYQGSNVAADQMVRGSLTYDFGAATLTVLSDYRSRPDSESEPAFGTPTQTTDYAQHTDDRAWQEEVRLNGVTSFGTTWQAGAFWLDHLNSNNTWVYTGQTAAFAAPRTVPALIFDIPHTLELISAGYGQVTQTITDGLSVIGGIRYTSVHQSDNPDDVEPFSAGSNPPSTVTYGVSNSGGALNYSKTIYKAGLNYQLNPDMLEYLAVSTGFKDGGFTSYNSYLPETITAYEVGSKNQFLNDRVQLNGALFYYDYKNQQFSLFEIPPGGGPAYTTTVNAGSSSLKGAELESVWLATPADRLSLSADYLYGVLGTFNVAESLVGVSNQVDADLIGKTPPQAPKWTFTGSWDHVWRLDGGASLDLNYFIRYLSSYYVGIFNWEGQYVNGYEESNAYLTYTSSSGKWDLGPYINNIENHSILNFAQFVNQGGANVYEFGWAPPRTFGLRLTVHLQ